MRREALLLATLLNSAHSFTMAEPISSAFGIALGEVPDSNIQITTTTNESGFIEWTVKPPIPHEFFSDYVLTITPLSNITFTIQATGKTESAEACHRRVRVLSEVLQTKYESTSDTLRNISDSVVSEQGWRFIHVACLGLGQDKIFVIFKDLNIKKVASEEVVNMDIQSVDNSGL